MGAGQSNSHSQSNKMVTSAPPKFGRGNFMGNNLMSDAQKISILQVGNDDRDKIQIPDNFEDSDTESETFGEKLKRIDAYGDSGQGCSKNKEEEVNRQVWIFENEQVNGDPRNTSLGQMKEGDKNTNGSTDQGLITVNTDPISVTESLEVFLPDDQIINTLGSVNVEEERPQELFQAIEVDTSLNKPEDQQHDKRVSDKLIDEESRQKRTQPMKINVSLNKPKDQHQERRSDRLKKDITMTTQEKNEFIAKKRNLEGTSISTSMFSDLSHSSMHNLSKQMGVVIEDDNGNSFDLLKEIETVRFNLFNKQQRAKTNVQIKEITDDGDE